MTTGNNPKDWRATLAAAGQWAWANRDRVRAAVQSEPVQELLKHPQAQKLLNHPRVRQALTDPELQRVLQSPEIQQWLSGVGQSQTTPAAADPAQPGPYAPYTGETQRLN
jgi:hypothetical protein